MPLFRKRPVVIEAVQWTGDNYDEIATFLAAGDHPLAFTNDGHRFLVIGTLEGDHQANPGDWIIKGVQGEFYPCKPNIFDATYEKAD